MAAVKNNDNSSHQNGKEWKQISQKKGRVPQASQLFLLVATSSLLAVGAFSFLTIEQGVADFATISKQQVIMGENLDLDTTSFTYSYIGYLKPATTEEAGSASPTTPQELDRNGAMVRVNRVSQGDLIYKVDFVEKIELPSGSKWTVSIYQDGQQIGNIVTIVQNAVNPGADEKATVVAKLATIPKFTVIKVDIDKIS